MAESESRGEPATGDLMHDHAVCVFQLGRKQGGAGGSSTAQSPWNRITAYRYASRAWIQGGDEGRGRRHCGLQKGPGTRPRGRHCARTTSGSWRSNTACANRPKSGFARADTLKGILKDAGVDPPRRPRTKRAPKRPTDTSTTLHGLARDDGRSDRCGSKKAARRSWTFVRKWIPHMIRDRGLFCDRIRERLPQHRSLGCGHLGRRDHPAARPPGGAQDSKKPRSKQAQYAGALAAAHHHPRASGAQSNSGLHRRQARVELLVELQQVAEGLRKVTHALPEWGSFDRFQPWGNGGPGRLQCRGPPLVGSQTGFPRSPQHQGHRSVELWKARLDRWTTGLFGPMERPASIAHCFS